MVRCAYCDQKITLAPHSFSGIHKAKFCMTCWHKIYTIHKAKKLIQREPILEGWADQIKESG